MSHQGADIHWPQAVEAQRHPEAFMLLSGDVERLCQYSERQGVEANAGEIAEELWQRFTRGEV